MAAEFKGKLGEGIEPDDASLNEAKRKRKHKDPDTNGHDTEPMPSGPADFTRPLEERQWAVPGRIPNENVTLVYGDGAIGKSLLLLHLGVAYALSADQLTPPRDWLGALPYGGKVLYISCEEDIRELSRRLQDIATFYQVTRDVIAGNMQVISWAGEDSTLCHPSKAGIGSQLAFTTRFHHLRSLALTLGPRPLIILDTVADMFGASENDRVQVRSFITALRALAIAIGGAIVLAAHPSVSGMASDSGLSGSTAWNNSVRSRAYFKRPKDDDDSDARVLEWKKANYGPISETLQLKYQGGVFVSLMSNPIEKAAAEARADSIFVEIMLRLAAAGQAVTSHACSTYAPNIFAKQNEARNAKLKKEVLEDAMHRLMKAGRIVVETTGPPSRPRSRLVLASSN